MLSLYAGKYQKDTGNLESRLFTNDLDTLKPSDYVKTNLAGAPAPPAQQQPTALQKLGWRRIYLIIPPVSALVKSLLDSGAYARTYGIYNSGQAGIAGFLEGLAAGILLDFGIEGMVQLYKEGKRRHWW